jgi:hypothetical protein
MGFAAWLAEIAKSIGLDCAFAPMSDEGRGWVTRAGLRVVEHGGT